MSHKLFIHFVSVVQHYGHKVLVEDNYSEEMLRDLIAALNALKSEADGK